MSSTYHTTVQAMTFAIIAGEPVFVVGGPGSGKTAVINALARRVVHVNCRTLIASIHEPPDFSGFACPDMAKGVVRLLPVGELWADLKDGDIVFLDELPCTPPATQAALLRPIAEDWVGDRQLPRISWVAAGNPVEQSAGGWHLAPPMANRFTHLSWNMDVGLWTEGLISGDWELPTIPDVPKDWEKTHGPEGRALVGAFVRKVPALMLQIPKEEHLAGAAWPSPRTWTKAARYLAITKASGAPQEVTQLLVMGVVGEGAGMEFLGWMRELDLPDPEEVLRNPETCRLPLDRGDKAHVILAGVVHAATKTESVDRWNRAWKVLARAAKERSADVAGHAAKTLVKHIPAGADAPPEAAAFAPILRAAGLMRARK